MSKFIEYARPIKAVWQEKIYNFKDGYHINKNPCTVYGETDKSYRVKVLGQFKYVRKHNVIFQEPKPPTRDNNNNYKPYKD